MASTNRARGTGNAKVGVLAGVLVGLLVVAVGFLTIRPQGIVATPSPSPAISSPAVDTPTPTVPTMTEDTPTPTPTPTATPTTPTPSVDTPVPGLVTSLPAGSTIAVLQSLPKGGNSGQDAVARAASLAKGGYTPSAIDSDKIPGLKKGFYAIAVTNLGSYADVKTVCAAMGIPLGNKCYPRTIGG